MYERNACNSSSISIRNLSGTNLYHNCIQYGNFGMSIWYGPRHEKTYLCHMRTTKAQICLRIHTVWSASLLSLPRLYKTSSFYIRNFKPLPSFCGCAGRFVSYLVTNPEDRFSRDEAHMIFKYCNAVPNYSQIIIQSYTHAVLLKLFLS